MQKTNSNQQTPSYRKRKCIAYKPNDFFSSFDQAQHKILTDYQTSAEQLMVKSLAILFDNIKKTAKLDITETSSPKGNKRINQQMLMSLRKNAPNFKKFKEDDNHEEQQFTNPERQIQEMVNFEKTGRKKSKSKQKKQYCVEQKENKPQNQSNTKKYQKLMNSLVRLSVGSQQVNQLQENIENIPHHHNRGQTEDTNLLEFDEDLIKNKTISELLDDSNRKCKELQNNNISPVDSQESQYNITDHSDNESSNDDGDYEQRFVYDKEDQDSPIFGTVFSQGGANYASNSQNKGPNFSNFSQNSLSHPPAKINFKPILDSPKKSKTKQKRLYINQKKVPRWAEDLRRVAEQYESNDQRRLRSHLKEDIFGVCIVEDMQTNTIFNRNDTYTRSSTVKWDHHPFVK